MRPRFFREEQGGVTAEFVIIFPLIVALLFMILFISLLIASASDLQQIAHELARASFSYLGRTSVPSDICNIMRSELLPDLVSQSRFLDLDKITLLACPAMPDGQGFVRIRMSYDFAGDLVQAVGDIFNIDLGILRREAITHISQ